MSADVGDNQSLALEFMGALDTGRNDRMAFGRITPND
jgi:hypothetical protein